MANLNNTSLEEFGKTLEHVLGRIHYSTRRTYNGSDLNADGVKREIAEEKNKIKSDLSQWLEKFNSGLEEHAKTLREINASTGNTYEEKKKNYIEILRADYKQKRKDAALGAGMDEQSAEIFAEKRANEKAEKLEKYINKISESFKRYPEIVNKAVDNSEKAFTQIEKKIRAEKRNQQLNALTFGFQGRVNQNIDKFATYGNALNGLGEGFAHKGEAMSRLASMRGAAGGGTAVKAMGGLASGLGKLGGVVKMVGGLFTKLAGPIGWVISGLQLFGDAINAINKYEIEQLGFDKEHYQAWLDFTKQFLDLENQAKTEEINYRYEVIQRNFDTESEIAKAAYSLSVDNYAKAVEISLGSITQGISQTAFSAASAAIEAGATAMTNVNTAAVEREKASASNKARSVKNERTLENITQDLVSANIGYENAESEISQRSLHNKQRHWPVSNMQDAKHGDLLGGPKLMLTGSGPEDNYGVTSSEKRYNSERGEAPDGTNRYSTKYKYIYQNDKSVGSAIGDAAINAGKSVTGALESTQELAEKNLEYANTLRAGNQEVLNTQVKNANNLAILQTEHETNLYNKKRDYDKSVYDLEVNGAKRVAQEYLKLTQKEFDVFGTLDETMRKSAIGVGILNENGIEGYVETMTHRMPDIMRKWGVTFEEIANMQNAYTESTGRSINLSNADFKKSLGLTLFTGDQGTTDELNADMQKFGMSVADSSDMFGEILDTARQLGLSTRKTGKDLVRDMKLANKYEFKGAKKALAEMSVWANKVRFDMSELPSVIEKQTGSFEDVISNAASIQVLGGNFANYMGDPLKNAFLGFQDPAELAKNANSALRGIGFFNSRTGKTEISTTDQIRMKAFSEATGISMENLRNQVFQMVQGDKVVNALTPKNRENYTKKQIELLQQQAHFSDGEWKVTLANGNEESINNLTKSDFADLMPHEEAMYDLTKKGVECLEELVGKGKKASGETAAEQISLFQEHTQQFYKTYDDMVIAAKQYFEDHKSKFQEELDNNLKIVRDSYKGYLQVADEGKKEIDAKVEQIQGSAATIANTLVAVSQLFTDAKTKLETELNNGKQENVEKKGKKAAEKVRNDADVKLQAGDRPQAQAQTKYEKQIEENRKRIIGETKGLMSTYEKNGELTHSQKSKLIENLKWLDGNYDKWALFNTDDNIYKDAKEMVDEGLFKGKEYHIRKVKELMKEYESGNQSISPKEMQNYLKKINSSYEPSFASNTPIGVYNDAKAMEKAGLLKINDGIIAKNGTVTKIDSKDQILAAKEGGPINQALQSIPSALPYPMPYESYVKENPYAVNTNNGGKMEVAPIEIRLSGNIQLSGSNGTVDITQQITNDPNFIRELSQMISKQFERQINGGRVSNAL